ncbi:MAG: isochorismate synthase, partial [Prevotella sp.]|nr:isochorismate synthase [Prevotella sp.]
MGAFAIYRLPYESECRLVMQEKGMPEELPSVAALSGKNGFAMAPFAADRKHPVIVIQPQEEVSFLPEELETGDGEAVEWRRRMEHILQEPKQEERIKAGTHTHYAIDFANFHSHIIEGEFSKIVLARCCRETPPEGLGAITMFTRACKRYPRLFVALVSAKRCGTWL